MQWCFSQVKGAIDDDVAEGMKSAKSPFFFFFHNPKRYWLGGLRGN